MAMSRFPRSNTHSSHQKNITRSTSQYGRGEISFSFEFFHQKEGYGFSEKDTSWFVNLFESLKLYSGYTEEHLATRGDLNQRAFIYRDKSIKARLSKDDFPQLYEALMSGQIELHQTRIHKTEGRLIFFRREGIFHIVLADPHHNSYATDDFPDYTKCYKLDSRDYYSQLVTKLEDFSSRVCHHKICDAHDELLSLTKGLNATRDRKTPIRCLVVQNKELITEIDTAIELTEGKLEDIIRAGVEAILTKKEQ